jgi:hypothetical protein
MEEKMPSKLKINFLASFHQQSFGLNYDCNSRNWKIKAMVLVLSIDGWLQYSCKID